MLKRLGLFFWMLPAALFSYSQNLIQDIRGVVIDKDSRRPLAGATVSIFEDSIKIAAITDSAGSFVLARVPVGRRRVQCSFSGYVSSITDNLIVNSAKEVEIIIEMEQYFRQEAEVVVKAPGNPKLPVNKMSVVSARSFTPEETNRYATSVNDPSRMAMSFPGVQPSRDTRSDINIRGNSAAGRN